MRPIHLAPHLDGRTGVLRILPLVSESHPIQFDDGAWRFNLMTGLGILYRTPASEWWGVRTATAVLSSLIGLEGRRSSDEGRAS